MAGISWGFFATIFSKMSPTWEKQYKEGTLFLHLPFFFSENLDFVSRKMTPKKKKSASGWSRRSTGWLIFWWNFLQESSALEGSSQDGRKWLITMMNFRPLRICLWFPFQMAFKLWLINGGTHPNHVSEPILQAFLRGGSECSHPGISLGGWNAFETQRVQWGKAWVTWLESVGWYLVNPIYKHLGHLEGGISAVSGLWLTITMVINHLLTGMILQVRDERDEIC